MGTKIGIILVDEEDTKENLIGGKQKKCRCIAKVTRTHQAIQVAAIRTRLKPVYPPLKKNFGRCDVSQPSEAPLLSICLIYTGLCPNLPARLLQTGRDRLASKSDVAPRRNSKATPAQSGQISVKLRHIVLEQRLFHSNERILALDDVACITQRIVGIINMQFEMTEVMHLETSFCL